jgi:prolipoprotein diacylglyceryltransferase
MFPITTHPHLAHALFEASAITIGAFYYRMLQRHAGVSLGALMEGGRFAVLLGCIFGAAIGNKLMFWVEMPHLLPLYWNKPDVWFAGQSMVGGLLGGLIGVELAKRQAGLRESTGDAFVFPVLLALMIGRTGCFVAGLADGTYGAPTELPWAIDFGDGVPRHPTQLYEILFAAVLWWWLAKRRALLAAESGLMFKLMLSAYLIWRLAVDALKPVPFDYGFGLSGIQLVCIVALTFYLPLTLRQWRKMEFAS